MALIQQVGVLVLDGPSPIHGFTWGSFLGLVLYTLIPVGIALVLGLRPLRQSRVQAVADAWRAGDSPDAAILVTRYLTRSRRFRGVGFAVAWSIPLVTVLVRSTAYPSDSVIAQGLAPTVGVSVFTAAIVLHETTYRLPSTAAVATLDPRRITTYLPRWMLAAPGLIGAVAVGVTVWTLLIAESGDGGRVAVEQLVGTFAMAAVVGLSYLTFVAISQRRQNLDSAEETMVDDTSRSFGSEVVWRAATGVALVTATNATWSLELAPNFAAGGWLTNWVLIPVLLVNLIGHVLVLAAAFASARRFRSTRTAESVAS